MPNNVELFLLKYGMLKRDYHENKTVYIRLNQDNGVEIMSTEPIAFTTDKGISLTAEDKIEITAKNELTLHCKKSQIKMDTKVDICGPDVRIN